MNIVVLMAGRGQRFVDAGYDIPKPLIKHKEMTILEHTTRSCPYIIHSRNGNYTEQAEKINLYFACLTEHKKYSIDEYLRETYGNTIKIIWFDAVTRGNLITALTVADAINPRDSLLLLDSDNAYNDNRFADAVTFVSTTEKDAMIICGFHAPNDLSQWANAVVSYGKVESIHEKNPLFVHHPALIGTFYFTSTALFSRYANYIVRHNMVSGQVGKEEFYISQVPALSAELGYPVHFHSVTNVIPLGTPDDLKVAL